MPKAQVDRIELHGNRRVLIVFLTVLRTKKARTKKKGSGGQSGFGIEIGDIPTRKRMTNQRVTGDISNHVFF